MKITGWVAHPIWGRKTFVIFPNKGSVVLSLFGLTFHFGPGWGYEWQGRDSKRFGDDDDDNF